MPLQHLHTRSQPVQCVLQQPATVVVRRLACRLSNNFREATRVVSQALPPSIPAGHVLVRIAFAGVNASDVNFTAGRYQTSIEQAQASLPFDAGFEGVGAVAALDPQTSGTFALLTSLFCIWLWHLLARARLQYTCSGDTN